MIDRAHREFSDEDISRIANTFSKFQDDTLEDEKGYCSVNTTDDIAEQDYVLTPGRYVGFKEDEDDEIPYEEKMEKLATELTKLFEKSNLLQAQINENLLELVK
jgi:type I restriction enzyme M protein